MQSIYFKTNISLLTVKYSWKHSFTSLQKPFRDYRSPFSIFYQDKMSEHMYVRGNLQEMQGTVKTKDWNKTME